MNFRVLKMAICSWLLAIAAVSTADAMQPKGRQHLINPGDEWSQLAAKLRPGDEIVLMPGVHRPAALEHLRGTPQRPIVIRSLNTEFPATINAALAAGGPTGGRYGLLLREMQYVVIKDLKIAGATVHGIEATAAKTTDEVGDSAPPANKAPTLTIRNVTIERIGPIGKRNAILLVGLDQVSVEQCRFQAWGGSAIELVACNDVSIEQCTFKGMPDYSQMNAVQIRAGSERVRIIDCVMVDSGVTAVALGGNSAVTDFRSNPSAQGSLYEAVRVRVSGNLIRGGHSAVAFINCDQCAVRNNTIIRPERWVYLILDQTAEESSHLAPTRRSNFSVNLIQWQPGDLQKLSHVRPQVVAAQTRNTRNEARGVLGVSLEQNLWWSANLEKSRSRLGEPAGTLQFPQVMNVDPMLDEHFMPQRSEAAMFGRHTP